jgi:hypothetical protein
MRFLVALSVLTLSIPVLAKQELSDFWKKPGWTCKIESKEVLLTNAKGTAEPKFLTCVYSAECDSEKASATVSTACRTTLENACPSVEDCIAMREDAKKRKDDSLEVVLGQPSDKDGTLHPSTEQKAVVEAQYGTGCKFNPEDHTAVVARKLKPTDTSLDKVCVNRVSCDTSRQRGVISQLACPATDVVKEIKGEEYPVCPGIKDCLASALSVRKPTRDLIAKELPSRPKTDTATVSNSGNGTVDVATHTRNAVFSK